MRYLTKFILVLIFIFNSYSQNNSNLRNLLLDAISPCYGNLLDNYESSETPNIFNDGFGIDDSKNGYMEVSGDFPTCGCACENIAGAFKQQNGEYTILINEYWSCETKSEFYANRNIKEIFPQNFGLNHFTSREYLPKTKYAIFKLDVEIPRKGTDITVNLELIPFGLNYSSESQEVYSYEENLSISKYLYGIKNIMNEINVIPSFYNYPQNESTLNLLLQGQYTSINDSHMKIIKNEINTSSDFYFKNIEEITLELKKLEQIYNIYKTMEYSSIIMSWNKEVNQFFIKRKIKSLKNKSFETFLRENYYWTGPKC